MGLQWRRIRSIVRKEIREYRRNRSVVATMAILPLIFLIQPLVVVLREPVAASSTLAHMHVLLYMLAIPVLVPATIAASAVVGERAQGSLEPVLTTPVRPEEFLLGKALAALIPSLVIAYGVYAIFLVITVLAAQPAIVTAVLQAPDIVAQVVFTPGLALLAIWIGVAISTRTSDLRVAQQLSLLGSLPLILVTSVVAFDVVRASLGLALGLGAVLFVADVIGWRVVAPMFDRERLVSGTR